MPWFQHGELSLHYIIEGEGQAVLLLHGWTCDLHDWTFQIPFLLSLGVQTIALDHRGHGRSSVPSSEDFRPETLADDAAALLDHLGLKDVIVFGHSMGTVVASALAVRHSHLVKAIILIDPVYYSTSKQLMPFVEAMSGLDSPEVAGSFFGRTFYTPATPEWLKAWHRRRAFSVPHEVVSKCIHGLYGMEDSIGKWEIAREYMNRRRCPRLVICMALTNAQKECELDLAAGDRCETVEEGHWPHQQASVECNEIIRGWLLACNLLELEPVKAA